MADEHQSSPRQGLSYRDAGVDIDRGNRLVERIGEAARRTRRPEVLQGLGGFGALFELPAERYRRPVLVSSTDGVGTKLKLAMALGNHDTIGIDLVAMCANDLVVQGAEPLFFLDYYATGHLDVDVAARVVDGIARGCEQAGMALVGGETAEMPGMYAGGDYDLAGFCVGVVDKERIIDGSTARPGDAVIGLAASGPHSNGYSLVRRILETSATPLDAPLGDRTLGAALLEPTRIYVAAMRSLIEARPVKAVAHITGGGLPENLPRVLPEDVGVEIDGGSWQWPPVFQWLQEQGDVARAEMLRTFNCGVGMVIVVDAADAERAIAHLGAAGERAWRLGTVVRHTGDGPRVRVS